MGLRRAQVAQEGTLGATALLQGVREYGEPRDEVRQVLAFWKVEL
jgi:hypothetical protein